MIKAAFFDIDGTLVSFNTHRVPESAIQAIENLRRQGVKIFLATGRHPIWVKNIGFEFDGFVRRGPVRLSISRHFQRMTLRLC